MDEPLIDLNSEVRLSRVLNICRYFNDEKPWGQLLSLNRCRYPSRGEFVPFRVGDDGVFYRLDDVLKFIAHNHPGRTYEWAQEVFKSYLVSSDAELDNLLESLGGDSDESDRASLYEENFYEALGVIVEVEDGVKQITGHLVALTKAYQSIASACVISGKPTTDYLAFAGLGAINDAKEVLFKLDGLASLVARPS